MNKLVEDNNINLLTIRKTIISIMVTMKVSTTVEMTSRIVQQVEGLSPIRSLLGAHFFDFPILNQHEFVQQGEGALIEED